MIANAEISGAPDEASQIDANALGQLSASAEGRLALLDLLAALAAQHDALELQRNGADDAARRRSAEAERLFALTSTARETGRYVRRIIATRLPSSLPSLELIERRLRRALAEATVSLDPALRRALDPLREPMKVPGDEWHERLKGVNEEMRNVIERVAGDIDRDRETEARRIDLFLGPPLP